MDDSERRIEKAMRRAQGIINTYTPGGRLASIDPHELKWLCEGALCWVRHINGGDVSQQELFGS